MPLTQGSGKYIIFLLKALIYRYWFLKSGTGSQDSCQSRFAVPLTS